MEKTVDQIGVDLAGRIALTAGAALHCPQTSPGMVCRTADPSAALGMTKGGAVLSSALRAGPANRRSLHYAPPDFLWRLVALASFIRLSLRKGAHAALSGAVWQEIRVRSGRDDKVEGGISR
jgi:hypothetical protein